MFWVRGKHFVVTCTRALMGVARCIYGNCFVGKYFVVCFSTTKTTKILPPPSKNTRYKVDVLTYVHTDAYVQENPQNCSSNSEGLGFVDTRPGLLGSVCR